MLYALQRGFCASAGGRTTSRVNELFHLLRKKPKIIEVLYQYLVNARVIDTPVSVHEEVSESRHRAQALTKACVSDYAIPKQLIERIRHPLRRAKRTSRDKMGCDSRYAFNRHDQRIGARITSLQIVLKSIR